ncbi:MAG TPA: DUF4339 domain-containing protein [Rhizomicrobium sp.]|nr:DUF4339 domain-containing protein [Rhizomicrobium sp.]
MSQTWTISVGSRIYGPYTAEQMRAFHAEGRLAPHSLIARTGEEQFCPAGEDLELAPLFGASTASSVPDDSNANAQEPRSAQEPRRFGQEAESASGERSRFVIISDMKSGSISALEEEIFNLGHAYRFMPQAWVLTSEASLNTIRLALIQKLGKLDTIFLVDTLHDRAAWFNFGPEADSRVRRMWSRTPEGARKTG